MSKTFLFIIGNKQDLEYQPESIDGITNLVRVNTPQMSREEFICSLIKDQLPTKIPSFIVFRDTQIRNVFFIEFEDNNITSKLINTKCKEILKSSELGVINNSTIYISEVTDISILSRNNLK